MAIPGDLESDKKLSADGSIEKKRTQIGSLQVGRALAAFFVIAHHVSQSVSAFVGNETIGFRGIFEYGYLGVDFFFVLSGFIIYFSVANKNQFALRPYLISRGNRVFLPYLPIGIAIALFYVFFPDVGKGDRDWNWLTTLTLCPSEGPPALSVAWTLRHELIFYLVFGVAFYFKKVWAFILIWLSAIIFFEVTGWTANSKIINQLFGAINVEFFMGIGVAVLFTKKISPSYILCGIWAMISIIGWWNFGASRSFSWIVGSGLAALVWGLIDIEERKGIGFPKAVLFFGDASYSLYLIHPLVVSVVPRILVKVTTNEFIVFGVTFLASVFAGTLYFVLVERPAVKFFRNHGRPSLVDRDDFNNCGSEAGKSLVKTSNLHTKIEIQEKPEA